MCQDTATARVRVDVASLKLICSALLCLLLPSLASAQAPTVSTDQPVRFAFDHDGARAVTFPILLDGVEVKSIPASALQSGTVTDSIPAVARGNHTLVACAVNADGIRSCSAELQFVSVDPAPNAPGNLRLLNTVQTVLRIDPRTGATEVESITASSWLLPAQ